MLPAWSLPPGFAQHWPLRQSYQLARCAGLFQPLHCYTEHDHPPARRPLTSLKAVNTFKGLEAQAVLARDRQQQHFLSGEDTTFRSIGLGKEVCEALVRAGFDRPAQVQVCTDRDGAAKSGYSIGLTSAVLAARFSDQAMQDRLRLPATSC